MIKKEKQIDAEALRKKMTDKKSKKMSFPDMIVESGEYLDSLVKPENGNIMVL